MRVSTLIGLGIVGHVTFACGGEENSYEAIAAKFKKPTGTLDSSNALAVAEAYEASSGASNLAGARRITQAVTQTQKIPCGTGGDITISVESSATGSSGSAEYSYNQCCYAASCCYDGGGTIYYAGSAGSLEYCATYDLSLTCGTTINLNYAVCVDGSAAQGTYTYLVSVNDKTFAVSGTYRNGNGTLSIKDSTGTYTCTYSNGGGSCSGTGSFAF